MLPPRYKINQLVKIIDKRKEQGQKEKVDNGLDDFG
jgi:hypothetical protein